MEEWSPSVTHLVATCRGAFLALRPALFEGRIAWRAPDAYDDWDTVSEALWDAIVASPIRHDTCGPLAVPRYGFAQDAPEAFIAVRHPNGREQALLAFVEFDSRSDDFDHVRCARLDESGRPSARSLSIVYADAAFTLAHWREGKLQQRDRVSVLG